MCRYSPSLVSPSEIPSDQYALEFGGELFNLYSNSFPFCKRRTIPFLSFFGSHSNAAQLDTRVSCSSLEGEGGIKDRTVQTTRKAYRDL